MKTLVSAGLIAIAVSAPTAALRAAPIATLYSTGVDAAGVPLGNNAPETHYTLTSVPGGTTDVRVATSANGFPLPPWLGDNSASAWIGPKSDASLNGPVGAYDYRITFSLSGLLPSSATIVGNWSVDDQGLDILLNGISTGITAAGFGSFYQFTLSSGFVDGSNTLDFIVNNGGGPTGLRVEMAGTAAIPAAAVPEAPSLALLGLGLLGLGMVGTRARRRVP